MDKFSHALKKMDLNFLGNGKHAMSLDAMKGALKDEHYLFLDVRTHEELGYLSLPFTKHIPMHELPDRLNELPKDKCIVTFCSSLFRAAVVYAYLMANDYPEIKFLTAASEDIALALKPGFVAKLA